MEITAQAAGKSFRALSVSSSKSECQRILNHATVLQTQCAVLHGSDGRR